jgi:hypothetical protein
MLKHLKNWIVHWLWFILVLWIVWISYATISSVTTGQTLTANMWNEMATQVNKNTISWVNNTRFYFTDSTNNYFSWTAWQTLPLYPSNSNIETNWNNIVLKAGKLYLIDYSARVDWTDQQEDEWFSLTLNYTSNNTWLIYFWSTTTSSLWKYVRWSSFWNSMLLYPQIDTEIYVKLNSIWTTTEIQRATTYLSVSEVNFWN